MHSKKRLFSFPEAAVAFAGLWTKNCQGATPGVLSPYLRILGLFQVSVIIQAEMEAFKLR